MKSKKLITATIIVLLMIALVSVIIFIKSPSKLTGKASSQSEANITIEQNVAIEFTDGVIDWGKGHNSPGAVTSTLISNGTVIDGTWEAESSGFVLENIGNINASIEITTGKNATEFIGGNSGNGPSYEWKMENLESGTCQNLRDTDYSQVNTSEETICPSMGFTSNNDELGIDIKIVIPEDTPKETKTDTITTIATAA